MYVDVLGCGDASGCWKVLGCGMLMSGMLVCRMLVGGMLVCSCVLISSGVMLSGVCFVFCFVILCPVNETINYITIVYNAFINRNEYLVSQRFVLN